MVNAIDDCIIIDKGKYMVKRYLTEPELLEMLTKTVETAGGQKAWCQAHGVSQPYLSLVLSGGAKPGEKICRALGMMRVTAYCKA